MLKGGILFCVVDFIDIVSTSPHHLKFHSGAKDSGWVVQHIVIAWKNWPSGISSYDVPKKDIYIFALVFLC